MEEYTFERHPPCEDKPPPGPEKTPSTAGRRETSKVFAATDINTIMATEFPPLRWTVPGYIAEGLSILAGRQKLGKTWLALDIAVAVAIGGKALGSVSCQQGDVLYLDYENGARRLKRRMETFFPSANHRPDLSRLMVSDSRITLGPDFIRALDKWRQSVPKPALVVVDVLQSIKPAGSASRNAYENDYAVLSELQHWATSSGVSVVVLHHTRKGGADDPLESLSGSNGLSACADATLVLDRSAEGITLYVRGRDVDEKETALRFDGGLFTIVGEASEVRRSDERTDVLDILLKAHEPMTPTEISGALGISSGTIRKRLWSMRMAHEVVRLPGRSAHYVHPEHAHLYDDGNAVRERGNAGNAVTDETTDDEDAPVERGNSGNAVTPERWAS